MTGLDDDLGLATRILMEMPVSPFENSQNSRSWTTRVPD